MNLKQKVNYLNFDRKGFIKGFKKTTSTFLITCRLFKTGNLRLAEINLKRIIDLLNITLQSKTIFDNNTIFFVLGEVGQYFDFLKEFSNSVKNIEDITTLKEMQNEFFKKQMEFEKYLNGDLSNPSEMISNKKEEIKT